MNYRAAVRAFAIIFFFSLFSGCYDLDVYYPSNGSYRIKALLNGASLEECSIIRSGDKIRPYFTTSVKSDPDLDGLLAYVQNSRGKITGDIYWYTIKTPADNAEKDLKKGKPVKIITVKSLDQELPSFILPENLDIGPYSLVLEAMGGKETFSRSLTDMFYVAGAEFNINDISFFLPGTSNSRFIPLGTTALLEAKLDYDSRFEPYVIWYSGKNIISEGKISEGAGNILWNAPEQPGFYSLHLEVFPFMLKRNFTGISREIALAVSPKAANPGYFFEEGQEYTVQSPLVTGTVFPSPARSTASLTEEPEEAKEERIPVNFLPPKLVRWYQFKGDLSDSIANQDEDRALVPVKESQSQWVNTGQSYGLSTGKDDVYLLPSINFFRNAGDQGGGIFLFHIKPQSEGVIFTAFFPYREFSDEGVWMDMIRKGDDIVLCLSAGEASVQMPLHLDTPDSFVPGAVEFFIQPYCLEAKLNMGEGDSMKSASGSIWLPNALSGESIVRLGGVRKNAGQKGSGPALPDIAPFPAEEGGAAIEKKAALTTIWNEFAILATELLLLPEEFMAAADTETGILPEEEKLPEQAVVIRVEVTREYRRMDNTDDDPDSEKE